jgi:hypothetical protein
MTFTGKASTACRTCRQRRVKVSPLAFVVSRCKCKAEYASVTRRVQLVNDARKNDANAWATLTQ